MPPPTTTTVKRRGEVPALPHSVKLAGSPRDLVWPQLCASCGGAAAERLPVTSVFDRDWRRRPLQGRSIDEFRNYAVRTIEVPFCSACAAQHLQEARPVGVVRVVISLISTPFVLPLLISGFAFSLYFFPELLGPAAALVAAPRTALQAAFFGVAALVSALVVWHQTRRRRVLPPTTITRVFDFSDNLGGLAGVEHRVYGMENARFAEAFAAVNAHRAWTADLQARSARRQAIAAGIAAVAILVALGIALI